MLTTSVERLEGYSVKITVTVPAEDVDKAIDATYKKLAGKYRFPGFRPGKTPRPVLDQNIGRENILADATEELVNTTYPMAIDAEGLRPIEAAEMNELDTVKPGEPYTYEAEIDVRPELTLEKSDEFAITMPEREATQADIDAWIEEARDRFATLEPVERGVQAGDFVLLSFVGTVDGEPYDGNEVDKYLYELGRGLMPIEFDEGLLGVKAGEEKHIEFVIPETSSNPDYVGKTAGFDVTVNEVKAKQLPEVDDEFAASVGGFDSLEELTEDIRNRMNLQKVTAWERGRERRLREQLAERLVGEVPESMIVQRQSTMMRDFISMIETRGMRIDEYLEQTGVDMDTIEADIRAQAEQSITEDLALEALFRAQGLEVTDADIDEELSTIAEATESNAEEARKRWEELGLMAIVREQVIHRKAVQWLMENGEVAIEPESPVEAEGAEGTKKAAKKKAPAKKAATEVAEPQDESDAVSGEEKE